MTWRKPKPPVNLHDPALFKYATDQYDMLVALTCQVLNDCAPILINLNPDVQVAVASAIAQMICQRNIVFIAEDFEAQPTALPPEKAKEADKITAEARKTLQT
jgi:hypothetical protein